MPDSVSDIDRSQGAGAASGQGGGLGLGERLRSARKAKAMSLEHVAEALHLDDSIVLALEEERFDELGAPVFVRGHLKAYARVVGLPADTVLDSYQRTAPEPVSAPPIERNVRRSVAINPVIWGFSGLVLLLGLVLAIYVMQDDEIDAAAPATTQDVDDPNAPAAEPVMPEPVVVTLSSGANESPEPRTPTRTVAPVVDEPPPVVDDEPEQVAASRAATSADVAAAPPAAAREPVARPPADLARLSLHFREESWVEISDANQRLLFGLQREGRRRELSGEPPFRLLIGNAAGVDVSVNDAPFVVPASDVSGKVARFEIDAAAFE